MYLDLTNQFLHRSRLKKQLGFPLLVLRGIAADHRWSAAVALKFARRALLAEAEAHHHVSLKDEAAVAVGVACAAGQITGSGRARGVAVQSTQPSVVGGVAQAVSAISRVLTVIHEGRIPRGTAEIAALTAASVTMKVATETKAHHQPEAYL